MEGALPAGPLVSLLVAALLPLPRQPASSLTPGFLHEPCTACSWSQPCPVPAAPCCPRGAVREGRPRAPCLLLEGRAPGQVGTWGPGGASDQPAVLPAWARLFRSTASAVQGAIRPRFLRG